MVRMQSNFPPHSKLRSSKLFFLLMILMVSLSSTVSADPIDDLVSQFFEGLKSHNDNASYRLTSAKFQEGTSAQQFESYTKQFPFLANFKNFTVVKKSINPPRASLEIRLDADFNPKQVNLVLLQENGVWKIDDFQLPENLEQAPVVDARVLFDAVHLQLQEIKKGNNQEAYQAFSKQFQKDNSLEQFESFLKEHPIFINFTSFDIQNPQLEKDKGSLLLNLKNQDQFFVFNYILIAEDQQWKILSLKLIHQGKIAASSHFSQDFVRKQQEFLSTNFDLTSLNKLVEGFLEGLKKNQVEQVYQQMATKAFRDKISLPDFTSFVQRHPILTSYTDYQFTDINLDNNLVKYSLNLINPAKKVFALHLDLAKDADEWKIQDIDVSSALEKKQLEQGEKTLDQDAKGMQFTHVKIGYRVDSSGLVNEAKSLLDSKSQDPIYVNLFILKGRKGTVVKMLFKNLDTDGFIPPISTTLNSDGDSVITFVFSAPAQGWPTGSYELRASAGSLNRVFNFRME